MKKSVLNHTVFKSSHKGFQIVLVVISVCSLSGCGTIDVPLGSMLGGNSIIAKAEPQKFEALQQIETEIVYTKPLDDLKDDITASIPQKHVLPVVEFSESDWAAITPTLHSQLNSPAPSTIPPVWLNAQTGAFGALHVPTRLHVAQLNGTLCQQFYVSLAHGTGQNWMRGTACKANAHTQWQTHDIHPSNPPL